MWKKKCTWNSSLWNSNSFIKNYRPTGFLHFPRFLLLLRSILLLLGFFFILGPISSRPLLFDFQSIRATTSQVQTESVHNFIVKVGFFFLRCFSFFFSFFFFGFRKKFHVGLWCFGFLLFCSTGFLLLGISSLFCWVSSPSSFFLSSLWNSSLTNSISMWLFCSTSELNSSLKDSIFVTNLDPLMLETLVC